MVQVEGLDRLLAEHPFFEGMDEDDRALIAGCGMNEVFDAGRYVFREGEPADKFYLLRSGAVAIEVHVPGRDPVVLETLTDGDIFGWSWMVKPYEWAYDVRAVQLTRVVSLDAKCLRAKMEDDHTLGFELFKRFVPIMASRMAATRLQLTDLYGNP